MKTTSKEKSQVEKFRELAREIGTADSEEPLNAALRKVAKANFGLKVCPECQHVFQGNGWDGIDSHWKARHDSVMPYAEAWPLIKSGQYLK
jgi:hypothetical protein